MKKLMDFLRGGRPEDRFAKRVMKRLQERGWKQPMQYDSARFAIVLGHGDDGGTIFLQNIFREVGSAAPEQQDAEIEKIVASAFEGKADQPFSDVSALLLPVIRGRFGFESLSLKSDFKASASLYDGAYKPCCGVFVMLAAVDYPSSMKMVTSKQLSDWSRSLDEVLAIAMENLRARSPCKFTRDDRGFYVSSYGDYYDASRILLPDVIRQLALKGDPVAVVVSRSAIVVAGSRDAPSLDAMAKFIEMHIPNEARPISLLPIVHRDGAWQPLDTSEAMYTSLDSLRVKQHLWDHEEQKTLLDTHYEKQGRDVFVASLAALEYQGRLRTWTSWAHNAASLLPQADVVILSSAEGRPHLVRQWADVEAICGPLKLEPGTYPPRYFVEQGPSAEMWTRLETTREHPSWFPAVPRPT